MHWTQTHSSRRQTECEHDTPNQQNTSIRAIYQVLPIRTKLDGLRKLRQSLIFKLCTMIYQLTHLMYAISLERVQTPCLQCVIGQDSRLRHARSNPRTACTIIRYYNLIRKNLSHHRWFAYFHISKNGKKNYDDHRQQKIDN